LRLFNLSGLLPLLLLAVSGIAAQTPFRVFMITTKAHDHMLQAQAAKKFLDTIGAANGFTVDFTTDTSLVNDANLAKYQAIVQMHLAPFEMSAKQQASFQKFIDQGKGWVGIHAAGLTGTQFLGAGTPYWQWYQDFFGGVVWTTHADLQTGTLIVEDRTHPVTKNLPADFTFKDEWYEFDKSPRSKVRVLGRVDESTYKPVKAMGDHPIIWTNEKYRGMVYIGISRDSTDWANPSYKLLMRDAVLWAGSPATTGITAKGNARVDMGRNGPASRGSAAAILFRGLRLIDASGRAVDPAFKIRFPSIP
jgi:type 1 glutamine amidotransferase